MDIPRETRMELNALCKEVFGVPSRWQKILKNGIRQAVTRKSIETIPGKEGEEPTTKEIDIPILTKDGNKQFTTKYYDLEDVRQLLLDYKKQLDEYRAQIKKQQEEQAEKEAQEKAIEDVKDAAQGSAAV